MEICMTTDKTLQIPIIVNTKKIEAHTMLVVLDDLNLLKIAKQMKATSSK